MYTPNDIRNSIRRIDQIKSDLCSKATRVSAGVETVGAWWKGDSSKAFIQGYRETDIEIHRLYSHIGDLEDGLSRLASEVDRADDERRRIEAERKRLEKEKHKGR